MDASQIIESLKLAIENDPFISLTSLQKRIKESLNIDVSRELVRVALKHRLNLSKKKAKFHGSPKTLPEKTMKFLEMRERFMKEGRSFVSIDETSFGRNWPDKRGYSLRGKPLYVVKKQPQRRTVSVLACASLQGWVMKKQKFDSFDTNSFYAFLTSLNLPPKTVVLLDNAAFHHAKVIKEFFAVQDIEALYTPPYSPWFNPIELCFSIVKRNFPKLQRY